MSRSKKQGGDDGGPGAPKYIISYSAMVTILLAFFIILQRLAEERQSGYEAAGIGPFKNAFNSTGLPGLLSGWREALQFSATGARYVPDTAAAKPNEDQPGGIDRLISPADADLANTLQMHIEAPQDVVLSVVATVKNGKLTADSQREIGRTASLLRECRNQIDVRCIVPPDIKPYAEGDTAWETGMRYAMIMAEHFCFREGISVDRVQALASIDDTAVTRAARNNNQRPPGPVFAVVLRPATESVIRRPPDPDRAKFRYEVRPKHGY